MVPLAVDHFTFPHLFTSRAVHLSLSMVNYYFRRLNAECKGLGRIGTLLKINCNIYILCLIVLLERYCTVITYDFFCSPPLLRDIRDTPFISITNAFTPPLMFN